MSRKYQLIVTWALVAVMLGVTLTGCSGNSKVAAGDLMKGINKNPVQLPQKMDGELNQALLDFTWNLFRESGANTGNVMISAPSVYLALGMTLNGADGETREAMLKALSAQNIKPEDFNLGLSAWMTSLMDKENKADVRIANSIWIRDGFEADPAFLQTNGDYYQAGIRSIDFADPSAPKIINQWVEEKTEGTIDKIIEKIDDDLMMYLINAIYFKGEWKDQFKAGSTYESTFSAPAGSVETPFMRRSGNMDYIQGKGATGVILPYTDERFAFVGILPGEGQSPRDFINTITAAEMLTLISTKKTKNIDLSLPKFESSYEDELQDELHALGMEIAFDPYRADFSLMNKAHTKDLFIGEVKHKTYIKVDEKGTEAAAVTGVGVSTTSMPIDLTQVVFDRPFVYAIIDWQTNSPLFVGIMEDPTVK
ncbi:serine protease inhibitor [Desulfitobacterium dehalogenans ATCC 51507]|uniref:Serine protease inhibitor n=1 Tax=Desulfitobacterium dehalogenans (strain ATCC 51507 / DSM 9161 / JW/IU-DC1) TaxID=756499 RepID=I4A4B5_DESDJ|nr:serpin family protein [Desulfitobacterium dehalogenans]AFL98799.1 serine protease inhibitor [Desulfitobacterium dehalogenans ATCC 51507]